MTFPGDINHEKIFHNSSMVESGKLPGCPDQDSIFNLIFTVAIFCLAGIKFPSGVFIDSCGPRLARTFGGILYVFAAVGLGFINIGYEGFLFPVFICICMGGSLLVISIYQVCNVIYRNSKSQVICILHGAFDSSAVVLLIFKVMYESGVDFRVISISYGSFCLILIVVGTLVLTPPKDVLFSWIEDEKLIGYDTLQDSIAGPDFAVNSVSSYRAKKKRSIAAKSKNYSSISTATKDNLFDSADDSDSEYHVQDPEKQDGVSTPLLSMSTERNISMFPKDSVLQSVFSSLYLFELIFLATFQLKLWYFVGSLPDNLGRLSHNNKETVSDYISIFGYIQFGGIFITPLIGMVFDRDNLFGCNKKMKMTSEEKRLRKLKQCIAPFTITIMLMMVLAALGLVEDIKYQIPQYILYTTVRGFVYANHGSYMAVAFPANQFGTLYGLGIFLAGCVGLFEYALFELTSGPFHGEPYYTNVILLIGVIFANLHSFNLWRYCRKESKRLNPQPQQQQQQQQQDSTVQS